MAVLHAIDPAPFAEACADLGASPDTAEFFRAHWRFDQSVYERLLPEMAGTYRALGIPDDPFGGLDRLVAGVAPRPFCLCHSDIHRKNIPIRAAEESLTLLDWELFLVGDPVYDLAVHFHKMRYAPDQEVCFVEVYVAAAPLSLAASAVRAEIDLYLKLERVKSAIIDACRVRRDLQSGKVTGASVTSEAARYACKFDNARAVWSQGERRAGADPDWVRDGLMG